MLLFIKNGSATIETFKTEQDCKEYAAGSVVQLELLDKYIRVFKNGGNQGYKLRYIDISSSYDDGKRLYLTCNIFDGYVKTLSFTHHCYIDRFIKELNRRIAIAHTSGIVI